MRYILSNIILVVCAVSIFMQPLFFSIMGLLGIEYGGIDTSPLYVVYVVILAGLSFCFYIYAAVVKGLLRAELALIGIVFGLLFVHGLWVIFDSGRTALFPEYLLFFLLLGLPGFFVAIIVLKLSLVPAVIRASEVLVIVIALGVAFFSVIPSLAGLRVTNIGGASYQTLSYYSAFSAGMLLIYNMHIPPEMRYRWISSLPARVVSYGLILISIVGCLLGGGRGAFVLLILYLVFVIFVLILNKNNLLTGKGIQKILVSLVSIFLLSTVFLTLFWDIEFVQSGFSRATQFLSDEGGVDLEQGSSGRDVVYKVALDYIQQRPLLGYGPFGFRDQTIQAHNLFLELWLQVGLIGVVLFFAIGFIFLIYCSKNWSIVSLWASALLLYPLVMTMFSGAYMHSSIFVFAISFLVVFRRPVVSIDGS